MNPEKLQQRLAEAHAENEAYKAHCVERSKKTGAELYRESIERIDAEVSRDMSQRRGQPAFFWIIVGIVIGINYAVWLGVLLK